jgi:hypothetical protein
LIGFRLERAADVGQRQDHGHIRSSTALHRRDCLCGVAGNVRLFQLLTQFGRSKAVAARVLFAWLIVNLFLGSQPHGFAAALLARRICQ